MNPRTGLRRRLVFLFFEAHTTTLELFLSLVLLGLGAWYANPSFETFSASPSYRAMQSIAPEEVWGLALMLTSLAHLAGLVFQWRRWRRLALSAATFFWLLLTMAFGVSNPMAAGALLFLFNAFGCLLCLMRPEKMNAKP